MSLHRFFVPGARLAEGQEITLPEEPGRQVARVLRMRAGDSIGLFDGSGMEWPSTIKAIARDTVTVVPGAPYDPGTEPRLMVTICPALVPSDRMEYVIQKSTELGAARVIPLLTERVQAKDAQVSGNRLARWRKIATEAAEQSGRAKVPEILGPRPLAQAVTDLAAEGPAILLWEGEPQRNLRVALRESLSGGPKHVAIFAGPVGGLSETEAVAARAAGAVTAGMGRRILRAETAPVTALSALMLEAGELE
jgi:16S rRNA (uracil1498-N3)-methyltransferase